MIRYFDTGHNGVADSLGRWLDAELIAGIRSFRAQFGFFDSAVLRPYLSVLRGMVDAGGTLRLVIGANTGNPPTTHDLAAVLPLVRAPDRTSLTVVGLTGALFHPKTMHLVRADGTQFGVVSSANFTRMGLGRSVEAGLIIESAVETDVLMQQIAAAIDRWATVAELGVYQIRTPEDIDGLRELGLAVTPAARRAIRMRERTAATTTGRGTRPVGWWPSAAPEALPEGEAEEIEGIVEFARAPTAAPAAAVQRWAKLLKRSDAQQVPDGTNPTGKLRLGQARFPINHATWFREVMFGDQEWVQSERRGLTYEEVHVPFQVSRDGSVWVRMTLKLDHGAHRVANQHNVPTVLSWGPDLGAWLRANNKVGSWVVIEKEVSGDFWLSIQATKPAWVP